MGREKKIHNQDEKSPKWLRRIQQNSWEPEILLSGIVVFGLLQLPQYIDQWAVFFRSEVFGNNLTGLFSGLKLAVYLLASGLIIHLFLRGVWIGFVGLSYAFPEGIKQDKFKFQPRFQESLKTIPSLTAQIDKLEKICSSIFSICFFLMMCIIGVMTGVLVFIAFIYLLDAITLGYFIKYYFKLFNTNLDYFISILVAVIALDFVFTGLFRKNRIIAKIYYPLHWIVGWVSLSRFYRPIYYTYASNVNRWVFSIVLMFFYILSIFLQNALNLRQDQNILSKIDFYSFESEQHFFGGYYQDRNEDWSSARAVIPSPVLKDKYLELIIKHQVAYESDIYQYCAVNPDSLDMLDDTAQDSIKLRCISLFYEVYIDGQRYENPDWMYYYYQKDKSKGFISFLNTEGLAPGKHLLEVKTHYRLGDFFARIPFFKE